MITTISAQEKIEYEKSITPLIAAETFEREGEFEKALEQYNKFMKEILSFLAIRFTRRWRACCSWKDTKM